MAHCSNDSEIIASEEAVLIDGLPIFTSWKTVEFILSLLSLFFQLMPTNLSSSPSIALCPLKLLLELLVADLIVWVGVFVPLPTVA